MTHLRILRPARFRLRAGGSRWRRTDGTWAPQLPEEGREGRA
jgi:hypothetical protein